MSDDDRIDVRLGASELNYQFIGGLLFLNRPGVHELIARCSSRESAQRLAQQHALRRATVGGVGEESPHG